MGLNRKIGLFAWILGAAFWAPCAASAKEVDCAVKLKSDRCNLAGMNAGDELQWHFDQTDFVVSLALQDSDAGGDFEVVPFVRSADDERYDAVARVLAGDRRDVTRLPMTPGTLLVFAGRNSIHRVAPVAGATPRLVALFGYDTKPGTMSSELLKAVRYGRIA